MLRQNSSSTAALLLVQEIWPSALRKLDGAGRDPTGGTCARYRVNAFRISLQRREARRMDDPERT